MTQRTSDWSTAAACTLAFVVCLVLIHPVAAMGANDDWSYIYTAKRLAETGHIYYNGWATAMLGPQLYLAALFIRILGFSFTVARASNMFLATLCVPLAFAFLRRCDIRTWNAAFGTLTLVLSPLYFPVATTFMSDIPALFFTLLFFYGCIRCIQSQGTAAVLWLAGATAAGLLAGSTRQIAWLTVLCSLPALGWHLRRQRRTAIAAVCLWLLSGLAVVAMIVWFRHQPYIAVEATFALKGSLAYNAFRMSKFLKSGVASSALLLSPVLCCIALRFRLHTKSQQIQFAAVFACVCLTMGYINRRNAPGWWGTQLLGDHVTTAGILFRSDLVGLRPLIVGYQLQTAVASLLLMVLGLSFAVVLQSLKPTTHQDVAPADRAFLWLAIPYTVAYMLLVLTRSLSYDRYYLPLYFVSIVAGLRWFEHSQRTTVSRLGLLPLLGLAAFGVAGTHDFYSFLRARVIASDRLLAAGVPRTSFHAGFEYDGWTQIEATGVVNEPRLSPASAYKPMSVPEELELLKPADRYPWQASTRPEPKRCYSWFFTYTPSIHAEYELQTEPGYCFPQSRFAPVPYSTWLPPHGRAIYVGSVAPQYR